MPTAGETGSWRRLLLFTAAGLECALPVERVREIVPMAALRRPPGLPAIFEGLLNLGGAAVPVLRLDRLFRLPDAAPGPGSRLIVLKDGPPMALLADAASAVVAVPAASILPVDPGSTFNACVEGELSRGGASAHLLSCARLLLKKESEAAALFQAEEQRRLDALGEAS